MAVLVVVCIAAVVVVAALVVYHRVFGRDARSIAGHHTRMERLGRPDRTVGSHWQRDARAVARVRVAEQRSVLTDDTCRNAYDLPSDGEQAVETASINTPAAAGWDGHRDSAAYHRGWGPPVQPAESRPAPPASRGWPAATAETVSDFEQPTSFSPVSATDPGGRNTTIRRSRRFLSLKHPISGVIALGAIILVAAIGVAINSQSGTHPQSVSNAGGRPISSSHRGAPSSAAHPVGVAPRPVATTLAPHGVIRARPAPAKPASPVTGAHPTLPAGNGPALTAISPAAGVAGQEVTLSGRNLVSSNGVIVVRFGATQARVVCPTQTTCQATVPSQVFTGSSRATTVTLSTDRATSKPVVFTYR